MTYQCNGCGTNYAIQTNLPQQSDCHYCPQCQRESSDPNTKPCVMEYIGGVLGSLPNRKNGEHFLEQRQFKPQGWRGLTVFVREADNTPMGNIAIKTADSVVVVVNGRHELEDLLFNYSQFMSDPTSENLPPKIDTLTPEHYDIARTAWLLRDVNLRDEEDQS